MELLSQELWKHVGLLAKCSLTYLFAIFSTTRKIFTLRCLNQPQMDVITFCVSSKVLLLSRYIDMVVRVVPVLKVSLSIAIITCRPCAESQFISCNYNVSSLCWKSVYHAIITCRPCAESQFINCNYIVPSPIDRHVK